MKTDIYMTYYHSSSDIICVTTYEEIKDYGTLCIHSSGGYALRMSYERALYLYNELGVALTRMKVLKEAHEAKSQEHKMEDTTA